MTPSSAGGQTFFSRLVAREILFPLLTRNQTAEAKAAW